MSYLLIDPFKIYGAQREMQQSASVFPTFIKICFYRIQKNVLFSGMTLLHSICKLRSQSGPKQDFPLDKPAWNTQKQPKKHCTQLPGICHHLIICEYQFTQFPIAAFCINTNRSNFSAFKELIGFNFNVHSVRIHFHFNYMLSSLFIDDKCVLVTGPAENIADRLIYAIIF